MVVAAAAGGGGGGATPGPPRGPHLLHLTGFQHPVRVVRLAGMGLMFHACVLRCTALFARELLLLLAGAAALSWVAGCSVLLPLGAALCALHAWCCFEAARRVEIIAGHRAGAKGYSGPLVENTVEAMAALVARDNGPDGPVADLVYVEIDVQETLDGELVVLHDFALAGAFPDTGANRQPYQALRGAGLREPVTAAQVCQLTAAQLRSLHLAGREGLHAPTLREFMAAFRAARCRRPLVVEIKRLLTDNGRELLVSLLREHRPYVQQQEVLYPQHRNPHLGFCALIAFPNYYASSVGELGFARWRHWTSRFVAECGVPVRCCFLECLSFCRGLPVNP